MTVRAEILSILPPGQWVALSAESEPRIVTCAPDYPAIADELNRRKIEHAVVIKTAA